MRRGGSIRAGGATRGGAKYDGRDGKTKSVHGSCGGGGLSFTLSVAAVASSVVAEAGKGWAVARAVEVRGSEGERSCKRRRRKKEVVQKGGVLHAV